MEMFRCRGGAEEMQQVQVRRCRYGDVQVQRRCRVQCRVQCRDADTEVQRC